LSAISGYDKPSPRSNVTLVAADEVDKLVEMLHSQAKVI